MTLKCSPLAFGTIRLYRWDDVEGRGGGALTVFPLGHDWEDIWLRVEMIGRGDAFFPKFSYKRGGQDDPWQSATNDGGQDFLRPQDMTPEFDPGEYWIGLFMGTALGSDRETEVAFDYFHSPQLSPLTVQTANTTTTTWGSLKQP